MEIPADVRRQALHPFQELLLPFGWKRVDGEHEPVAELQRALDQEKERLRFWTLDAGEARDIP